MYNQLVGKTALITGSTSGIGLGIAISLAKYGVNIILNGFGSEEVIDTAKKQVLASAKENNFDIKVTHFNADMASISQIEHMIKTINADNNVDILVNNAGIQHISPIEDFQVEKWNEIIAINLSASFHTMRLIIPAMRKANWGRIINIASAHAIVASAHKSAYVASKHGLLGITKSVALELAITGITVNAICPGWVKTAMVERQIINKASALNISIEQATINLLADKEPSLQFTTVEQLGELAVFLCSSAADNIKGASISADGGWTAQ
jgi:3-hydroxybutyrate dehydrogenase